MQNLRYFLPFAVVLCALTGCSSDGETSPSVTTAGDSQTPPSSNGTDVEAWIAGGAYQKWKCEDTSHPQIKVSPHGHNRICTNALIENFTGGVGDERPKGSAGVKELYNDSNQLVGYAVSLKLADTSDGGKNWYWYERVPLDSAAPHDPATGVVADGIGGTPKTPPNDICVGCHSGAGSDSDAHLVNKSSDYVYDVIQ